MTTEREKPKTTTTTTDATQLQWAPKGPLGSSPDAVPVPVSDPDPDPVPVPCLRHIPSRLHGAVGGKTSASFEYVLKCGNLSRLETRQLSCCPHQTNEADDQRFINKTFVRLKSLNPKLAQTSMKWRLLSVVTISIIHKCQCELPTTTGIEFLSIVGD